MKRQVLAAVITTITVLAASLLAVSPASAANLVTNPGFESGSGWTFTGTAGYQANNPHSGSRSARIGVLTGMAYQDLTSGFTVGQVYALSAWGKVSAQSETGFVGVQALNSSGTVLYDAKTPFIETSYMQNATTFLVPTGTTKLRVYLWKDDGPKAGYFWADDLSLDVATGVKYYVDSVSGSDSNAGTSAGAAWRTIAKLNTRTFLPGDSILFRGGQTFTGSLTLTSADGGTLAAPVTISSYGGGRATLSSGTTGAGISATDTGGYHIYNLNLLGGGYLTNTFNGVDFVNSSTTTRRPLIHLDALDVQGYFNGIHLLGAAGKGWEPITMLSLDSHDNYREGVSVWGWDSAGEAGGTWYAQDVHANVYIGYVTSYNNHAWSGIFASNSEWATIEHSTAHHIGELCPPGAGPVGIWSFGSENVTVQFNTAYAVSSSDDRHDGDGFNISSNNTAALYQYNYAYGNDGPGFLIDEYIDTTVGTDNVVARYNVSQNNCLANDYCGEFYVYGPVKEAHVYNNTVHVSNAASAGFRTTGSWDSADPIVGPVNLRIRNNIISSANNAELVHVTAAGEGGLAWGDGGAVQFQGNLYYASGTFAIHFKGTSYASLSAFRAVPQEKNGVSNVGVQANPLLVAPATNGAATNLKSASGSPAKNAGLNLNSLFGTSVGAIDHFSTSLPVGNYDIGAEEK